jgi:hypothetical protein
MKQAHWIGALLALAALVFGITFTMSYLGGSRPAPAKKRVIEAPRQLEFSYNFGPIQMDETTGLIQQANLTRVGLECEESQKGHYDFWFNNANQDALPMGLKKKSCVCANVQAFVLRAGPMGLVNYAAARWGLAVNGPLAAAGFQALASHGLEAAAEKHDLWKRETPLDLPPAACGWIRMFWKSEKIGPQFFWAELWTDRQESGLKQRLETWVVLHPALRAHNGLTIPDLNDTDLPHKSEIICWSSTRPHLRIRAELTGQRSKGADPFALGDIQELSAEERAELQKANNDDIQTRETAFPGKVLFAARIPITLHRRSPDGKTPFDLGLFRRQVVILTDDAKMEPIKVEVKGRVRGLIDVGGDEEGSGGVSLGSFPRKAGSKRVELPLRALVNGLTLELDKTRTPRFLKVDLGETTAQSTDQRQNWTLRVEAGPGAVDGIFPRSPLYEDCAIYLKAKLKGKPPQPIRIPVRGVAMDG